MSESQHHDQAAPTPASRAIGRFLLIIPLIFVIALLGLFAYWLKFQQQTGYDPKTVPSALIGKPVPDFDMPPLEGLNRDGQPVPGLASGDLARDRVSLVNVWASWCVPCRQEHPILMELAKDASLDLVGLNYKDKTENARRFLGSLGNPYSAVGVDARGRVGIDWGVYGVPETFVVADGRIFYKFIGPLSEESLKKVLMPEIEKARGHLAGRR